MGRGRPSKYPVIQVGDRFGLWRIDSFGPMIPSGSSYNCTCLGCGVSKNVPHSNLISGKSKGCVDCMGKKKRLRPAHKQKFRKKKLTCNGVTQTFEEWSKTLNLPRKDLRKFLQKGLTIESVFKLTRAK